MTIKIRKPFQKLTTKPVVDCSGDVVLVEQSHKHETDINVIVSKFQRTGVLEHQRDNPGQFVEVDPLDYHEAMNIIADANSQFEQMPANIRKDFGNDPAAFLAFTQDPANVDKMKEYGMLNPSYSTQEPVGDTGATAPAEETASAESETASAE